MQTYFFLSANINVILFLDSVLSMNFTFKIPEYRIVNGTVFYKAIAYCKSTHRQQVFEWRYSTLLEVHQELAKKFPKTPSFPPKNALMFWLKNDPSFINQRRAQLQNYLNTLINNFPLEELDFLRNHLNPLLEQQKSVQRPQQRSMTHLRSGTLKQKCEQKLRVLTSKLIVVNNEEVPDDEELKHRREQYEKIRLEFKSQLLQKYKLPRGVRKQLNVDGEALQHLLALRVRLQTEQPCHSVLLRWT